MKYEHTMTQNRETPTIHKPRHPVETLILQHTTKSPDSIVAQRNKIREPNQPQQTEI